MIARRDFLTLGLKGIILAAAAPAIVRPSSLMKLWVPRPYVEAICRIPVMSYPHEVMACASCDVLSVTSFDFAHAELDRYVRIWACARHPEWPAVIIKSVERTVVTPAWGPGYGLQNIYTLAAA